MFFLLLAPSWTVLTSSSPCTLLDCAHLLTLHPPGLCSPHHDAASWSVLTSSQCTFWSVSFGQRQIDSHTGHSFHSSGQTRMLGQVTTTLVVLK